MYNNYKSDINHQFCYVPRNKNTWQDNNFFRNIKERWNGQHRLLATTDSPTISACTTATNLSSLDNLYQSFGSSIFNPRKMGTLERNIHATQPEIEPLNIKQNGEKTNISIEDDSYAENVYNKTTIDIEKPPRRNILKQVISALSVSLVSLVVGFVSAYTSPAAESLMADIQITKNEFSWICGLMPLSALLGGLAGGPMIEVIGRKWTIIVTDILFVIGWIVMGLAGNVWMLYSSRIISGLSVGIASLVLPVYLGETVQPEVRGSLGLLPTAFGNIGILLCFTAGNYLKWDHLAWLGVVLPIPFLLLAFVIPETPRWYVSKGKEDSSRKALQWLRGANTNIKEEFDELVNSQQKNDATNSSLAELFSRNNVKALLISLGLMFFQQMSGINAVIFYTTTIFEMAGSTIDNKICTIVVGVVNFVSTFIATVLIDRLGRKVLLYISSVSMTITLGVLGTYFYLSYLEIEVSSYGWLPLVSFVIYVLGFSLGFGPIPWLMMGEILPAKIRGPAASVATSFNWTCTFVVTKAFVNILDLIGAHGTFWMFSIIIMISIVFIFFCVPETRGQSLQDIEKQLAGKKVRRMSSVANLKPMPLSF